MHSPSPNSTQEQLDDCSDEEILSKLSELNTKVKSEVQGKKGVNGNYITTHAYLRELNGASIIEVLRYIKSSALTSIKNRNYEQVDILIKRLDKIASIFPNSSDILSITEYKRYIEEAYLCYKGLPEKSKETISKTSRKAQKIIDDHKK